MSSRASSRSRQSSTGSAGPSSGPSSITSNSETGPLVTRWIIDTRSLWPGDKIQYAAAEYLPIISNDERKNVLRKYHIADAKMSLASALLKRAYIAKVTDLPWSAIHFSRRGHPQHGKPCWNPPDASRPGMPWPKVDFNVSHQAGLVTLVGVCVADAQQCQEDVLIGCDIVAPHERADLEAIKATDFEDFTSTFAEIFSSDELWDISYNLPSHSVTLLNGQTLSSKSLGRLDRTIVCDQIMRVKLEDGRTEEFVSDLVIDAKLRRFYTFFCLKEAYIKLVGEGLLASWIKECEFKNVRAPTQGTVARCSTHGTWGGTVHGGRNAMEQSSGDIEEDKSEEEDMEIWLNGEELPNVRTEVQAYEENYMIATMIKPSSLLGSSVHFPKWERVNLEKDILDVARKDTKKLY